MTAASAADCAVVIPAYNEAHTIRGVAERALAQAQRVMVVDDGSADGTCAALAGLPVELLRNERNLGKAGALLRGMEAALAGGAQAVITLDGDGQHPPEAIPALLAAFRADPRSLVIAARLENRERAPRARRRANEVADFWISWAAGRRIQDTQSGFRLYPATLLRELDLARHRESGFVFESEILIDAARAGYGVSAVAIPSLYFAAARRSHFRPVRDIARIVVMVAGKLLARGMYPQGLWRALRR